MIYNFLNYHFLSFFMLSLLPDATLKLLIFSLRKKALEPLFLTHNFSVPKKLSLSDFFCSHQHTELSYVSII